MGCRSLAIFGMLVFIVVAGNVGAQQIDQFVHAKSYCIMDADTGRVLSSQNPHLMLPPASTLKVGTALVAIGSLKLTDRIPVSPHAAAAPPSKINIRPGETYSVQDILYAVLLASANDAARALAEKVSGSEEMFAAYMTSRLRQLGAYRTNFETASGLPAAGQYSTAYDLALIFYHAIQNPTLARIMSTKTFCLDNGKDVRNNNRFLFSTQYAVAGKTGWTRASQHTFVGLFRNGDKRIIISLMGSPNKWPDLRLLIAQGFSGMGTPIAALPPLEERLRRTSTGFVMAGENGSRPHRSVKSRSKVVRAGIASSGGKNSRSSGAWQSGQKKKSSKSKARTSASTSNKSRS